MRAVPLNHVRSHEQLVRVQRSERRFEQFVPPELTERGTFRPRPPSTPESERGDGQLEAMSNPFDDLSVEIDARSQFSFFSDNRTEN
jgi:hypothetical protein